MAASTPQDLPGDGATSNSGGLLRSLRILLANLLAVVALTFFVMVLFWDTHRVMAAGVIVLAYAVIGIVCSCIAHSRSRVKSKLFSASLAELGKDGARLSRP